MEKIKTHPSLTHYAVQKSGKGGLLCAICDGMGGGVRGEEAALLAVKALQGWKTERFFRMEETALEQEFIRKIQQLNDFIYETINKGKKIGGCTMTLLYLDKKKTFVVNVGDSPCICFKQDICKVVSVADNHAGQLYRWGEITEKAQWKHPGKSHLTQYLGMDPDSVLLSPHIYKASTLGEELYLLASDGLLDMLIPEDIGELLKKIQPGKNLAEELVDAAKRSGSRDNITVIVVRKEDKK